MKTISEEDLWECRKQKYEKGYGYWQYKHSATQRGYYYGYAPMSQLKVIYWEKRGLEKLPVCQFIG